jgi:hypothetical protein
MYHASMEKDELWVPPTKSDSDINTPAERLDLDKYFGDMPLYTLVGLLFQQFVGLPAYFGELLLLILSYLTC